MKFLKGFWKWLSGKKMLIGLSITWIIGRAWFWDLIPDGTIETILKDVLPIVGNTLAGLGLFHKGIKAVKK